MRYPEGGHQPSKAYTRSQASKAMDLANQIINKVDEYLWHSSVMTLQYKEKQHSIVLEWKYRVLGESMSL